MIKLLDILKEAKQVGTLYHSTSGANLISILKSNTLRVNQSPTFGISLLNQISFTRDKNYRPGEYTIEIDGNKLSSKYKLEPFQHYRKGEAEEVTKQDIVNVSDYINAISANVEAVEQESYKEFERVLKLYPPLSFTVGGKVLIGDTIERSSPVREIPKQEAMTYIKYNKY